MQHIQHSRNRRPVSPWLSWEGCAVVGNGTKRQIIGHPSKASNHESSLSRSFLRSTRHRENFIGLALSRWTLSVWVLSGWQKNPVGVMRYLKFPRGGEGWLWFSLGWWYVRKVVWGGNHTTWRGVGVWKISLKGLGLLLNFGRVCRGDTNVSGVHPGAPRCTPVHPGRGSDKGCSFLVSFHWMNRLHDDVTNNNKTFLPYSNFIPHIFIFSFHFYVLFM